MVYANDQWVQLPTKDLYDTQMMAIAINAAKDMYEKGQQEMKDFNKLYGDFYTPIVGDQDKYNSTVIDPVKNVINAIYAAGGDPLRNPEARALISRTINSINTGDVAKWKQRAENARAWYKNMAELRSKGLYNEDFSEFLKETPDQWGENSMGFTSPTAYDDLNAHTSHWFDKLDKNQYLRTEGMYDIHGVKPEDLNSVMDQMMPDFVNSDYGRYQMDLAKRKLGPDATTSDVIDQLRKNIVSANKELTLPTRKINEIKMAQFSAELKDKYDARRQAREYQNNRLLKFDLNGDGKIDADEMKYHEQVAKEAIDKKLGKNNIDSWTLRQRREISKKMNQYAYSVNTAKQGRSLSGAKQQLIAEGVANPTTQQIQERAEYNKKLYSDLASKMLSPNGITPESLAFLNAYYNAYQTVPQGEDKTTALLFAAAGANAESINGLESGHKRLPIMFEPDGELQLTRQRQTAYAGFKLSNNSITNQLYRYLANHGIEGYIPNRDVTVNRMISENGNVWDINFTGRFKKEDLVKFRGSGSEQFYKAMANAGARYVTKSGKKIIADGTENNGKLQWGDIEYIDIPLTRTIDEGEETNNELDMYHNRRVFGQSNAAKGIK